MFYIKGIFYIKGCDKACPQLSLLSTIFVFRADPSSEMAALASNLLEHIYSAINGWILMKLDRKQFMNVCLIPCLWFLCRSVIKGDHPVIWFPESFMQLLDEFDETQWGASTQCCLPSMERQINRNSYI